MPFGDWVNFWYETYRKPEIRPSTQRCYDGFIRLYIRPKLGDIPLNKLTTNDLQQLYIWMRTDGRSRDRELNGAGLSENLLQNCHSICRRALQKAVDEGLISRNPAVNAKLPPSHREEMKILTREEMQRVLIQAKEEGYYEVFLVEFATGLREGELATLQCDDLNMTTGELRISKTASRTKGEMVTSPPKTRTCYTKLQLQS